MRPSPICNLVTVMFIGVGCSGGSSFGSAPASGGSGGAIGGSATGGATASNGGGATVGTGGVTGFEALTCEQLVATYATVLGQAKACSANATTAACTKQVPLSALACGCPTFVNSGNANPIANLQKLAEAYDAKSCAGACTAIACVSPTSASCSSSGTGSAGRCVDNPTATTN